MKAASTSTTAPHRTFSSPPPCREPTTFRQSAPGWAASAISSFAAKYRFLRQDSFGVDVAVFPRVFVPSVASNVGDQHASFLLPIWVEKDWGDWSTFGGGGCEAQAAAAIPQGFCLMGMVVTRQVFHQFAARPGGLPSDRRHDRRCRNRHRIGAGIKYDLNDNYPPAGLSRSRRPECRRDQSPSTGIPRCSSRFDRSARRLPPHRQPAAVPRPRRPRKHHMEVSERRLDRRRRARWPHRRQPPRFARRPGDRDRGRFGLELPVQFPHR